VKKIGYRDWPIGLLVYWLIDLLAIKLTYWP